MKRQMFTFALCAAWSSVIVCAQPKVTATATKSAKPAGLATTSTTKSPVDAQKVLDDMKKRLEGNRKMLGTLKAEWQTKRDALQKNVTSKKANGSVAVKAGANKAVVNKVVVNKAVVNKVGVNSKKIVATTKA